MIEKGDSSHFVHDKLMQGNPENHFLQLRVKWENILMYSVGLRMLRKRDEHHRLQNDSIKAAKAEKLWGPGFLWVKRMKNLC